MMGSLAFAILTCFSLSGALHKLKDRRHLNTMLHVVSATDDPFLSVRGPITPTMTSHADAAYTVIALELPGWGILSVRGDSRLEFLHGLSTNSFKAGVDASSAAVVGSVIFTAFANAQGRLISFCKAIITEDEVQLLCEPASVKILFDYLNRFIFPSDRVEVVDVSSEVAILSISLVQLDPGTNDVMHWNERGKLGKLDESTFHRIRFESDGQKDGKEEELHEGSGWGSAIVIPAASEVDVTAAKALLCTSKGEDVRSVTRSCLVDSAFCVVKQAATPASCSTADMKTSATQSATRESNLIALIYSAARLILSGDIGGRDNNDVAKQTNLQTRIMFGGGDVGAVWWDCARRVVGRPTAANEVNYNVTALECGLMHGLHFRKGCFVGQETISKTVSLTSNGVRRRLCALSIRKNGDDAALAGDTIVDQDGDVVGIVTSGTGTGTGTAVKLPSLKLLDDAIITSRDSSAGLSMEACNQEVMLDIASSLEVYVNQHCLALLKSSYATNCLQGIELSIRPHSSRMNVAAPVAVVAVHSHSLPYPTFDKKFSPCPPLDRGSKSSELLLLNVATAAAAAGTSDLKTSPLSTALSASAEAERKSAKMIEMAKKVAALKARQQKGIGSSL